MSVGSGQGGFTEGALYGARDPRLSGVEEKQAAPELALPKQGVVSWETRQELV